MQDPKPIPEQPVFAVGDLVNVDGDQPGRAPWRITEIVTDDPQHDGPYARLVDTADAGRSWSALRILFHAPTWAVTGGPWKVFLLDAEGNVLTDVTEALDQRGPEAEVEISIRRGAALPDRSSAGSWRIYGPGPSEDVALRVHLDLVDEDGETTAVESRLKQAEAMAGGLNAAASNKGDWNRRTELAAALHDVADRVALFEGTLPSYQHLTLAFLEGFGRRDQQILDKVDALGALLGVTAEDKKQTSQSWIHEAETKINSFTVQVYSPISAPPEEDPAALRERIAELELRLAQERGEA